MARELPIHNGRLTTDLDADGHRIKNLPGGTETVSWDNVTGKPQTFPPSQHTHAASDVSGLATVATSGSYNDLQNKPTIPAVDQTLATHGAAADAKAVGDALRGGFTEWEFTWDGEHGAWEPYGSVDFYDGTWTQSIINGIQFDIAQVTAGADATSLELHFNLTGLSATMVRHLVTPTKTSQLTNDGDGTNAFVKTNDTRLSDARTPTAHTHAMADVTGLATALSQKANTSDLPYALVTPGEWEFSGSGYDPSNMYSVEVEDFTDIGEMFSYKLYVNGGFVESVNLQPLNLLSVDFTESSITATRASLPGHLFDRAGNRVVVSGDTTLTLPAANPGYLRDFLVRLEISGSTVPTITFAAPTGETITYETDGDEFPVPDEAGTWSYSFTENCVAHKFAVSLKKVNTVAQGGA